MEVQSVPRRDRAEGRALLLADRVRGGARRRAPGEPSATSPRRARSPTPRSGSCTSAARSRSARGTTGPSATATPATLRRQRRLDAGEPEADDYRRLGARRPASSCGPSRPAASYINFQTADEDEARLRATYGANFDRLVEIKRRYDPSKRVPRQSQRRASMRLEAERGFDVPVRDGFDYITDQRNWPEYWPGFVRIEPGSRWSEPGDVTQHGRADRRACCAARDDAAPLRATTTPSSTRARSPECRTLGMSASSTTSTAGCTTGSP